MIKKAEQKVTIFHSKSSDKNFNQIDELEIEEQGELDYPMFKTYLLAPSLESQRSILIKRISTLEFDEYENEEGDV